MTHIERRKLNQSTMEKIITDCALFEAEKKIKELQDELSRLNELGAETLKELDWMLPLCLLKNPKDTLEDSMPEILENYSHVACVQTYLALRQSCQLNIKSSPTKQGE